MGWAKNQQRVGQKPMPNPERANRLPKLSTSTRREVGLVVREVGRGNEEKREKRREEKRKRRERREEKRREEKRRRRRREEEEKKERTDSSGGRVGGARRWGPQPHGRDDVAVVPWTCSACSRAPRAACCAHVLYCTGNHSLQCLRCATY